VTAAAHAGPRGGVLKSVAVRVARRTRERMMTLVVADDADRALRAATRRALDGTGGDTALHVNVHPRANAMIFGDVTRRLSGPERLRDEVAGASFLISPTAFFQTNVAAGELLVDLVRRALPAGVPVLDLYAGVGLFARFLATASGPLAQDSPHTSVDWMQQGVEISRGLGPDGNDSLIMALMFSRWQISRPTSEVMRSPAGRPMN